MAHAPPGDKLQGLLNRNILRLMKMLTRCGYLIEEQGMSSLADIGGDDPLKRVPAASCMYVIALGSCAGQKVLSLRTVADRDEKASSPELRALRPTASAHMRAYASAKVTRTPVLSHHPTSDRQQQPSETGYGRSGSRAASDERRLSSGLISEAANGRYPEN